MSAILKAASAEELLDLALWCEEHPADSDPKLRTRVWDWICALVALHDNNPSYPISVQVPDNLIEPLDALIEDWIEVLTAHGEELSTELVRS